MKAAKLQRPLIMPSSWTQITWGNHFREALTHHLKPALTKLYGLHLLKIGALSAEIDTNNCSILHQITVGVNQHNAQVVADFVHMPFKSKSIDACLLVHTLAWCQHPHRVLYEIDRVLIDDGWLIISCFNPGSLLGLGKAVPGLRRKAPWNSRMLSQTRLLDWLHLLNHEVLYCTRFQVIPWHGQENRLVNKHFPALGCLNIIVARKRTYPLNCILEKNYAKKQTLQPVINSTCQSTRSKLSSPSCCC